VQKNNVFSSFGFATGQNLFSKVTITELVNGLEAIYKTALHQPTHPLV
jgi:hypothetical protein